MKKNENIIWGILIVVLGVVLLLKSTGILDFDIFFEGWWTLFIIVPSVISLFTDKDKIGSIIGILIGVLLLLAVRDVIDFDLIWKILVPVIIILVGLSLIFRDFFKGKIKDKIKELDTNNQSYTAVFAGQSYKLTKEEFKGCEMNAIFGGIELDLRNAKFTKDTKIKLCCLFGGIDISVPEDINVQIVSNSFFGGVDDKREDLKEEGKHTIYVDATCIFGGVDIK